MGLASGVEAAVADAGLGGGWGTGTGRGASAGSDGGAGEATAGAGGSRAWRASAVSMRAAAGGRTGGAERGGIEAGRAMGTWASLRIGYKSRIAAWNSGQVAGSSSVSRMAANVSQDASSV